MIDRTDEILLLLAQCDALLNDAIVWNEITDALYEHRSELQSALKHLIRTEAAADAR